MFEQFQDVLKTPKQSSTGLLNRIQDMLLTCLEEFLPSSFDFSFISVIYEQELGAEKAEKLQMGQSISLTLEQQISINFRIVQYFVNCLKLNFINPDVYQALEEQTQKAESTIRSHIKIQQEMKMYLQYLESKLSNYEKEFERYGPDTNNLKHQLQVLKNRQQILYRQKVNLIKRNEELSYKLEQLDSNSKIVNSNKINNEKVIEYLLINARQGESRLSLHQNSPPTKQKQYFPHYAYEHDLTQKKQSTYFPYMR